jgi:hypothetical protein
MLTAVSPLLRQYSRTENPNPPTHLGTRYDTAGTFLPEPGNTVVCHLEAGSPTEAALIDARARFLGMPEARNLAFTPVSSLHMTLFQGIIEGRRAAPFWPSDLPLDTPIAEMTALMLERLKPYAGGPPFKVQVTDALPTGLKLDGATAADRQALRDWRDAFAEILGYRHPDHDDYVFHITFSYVIARFDDAALPAWQQMLDEVVRDIAARAPVLELRPPAFCAFEDMNHFEELWVFERAFPRQPPLPQG